MINKIFSLAAAKPHCLVTYHADRYPLTLSVNAVLTLLLLGAAPVANAEPLAYSLSLLSDYGVGIADILAAFSVGSFAAFIGARHKAVQCAKNTAMVTQKLRASNDKLSYMVANSPTILFSMRVSNKKLGTTWVSENITRITGYHPEQVMAPSWWVNNLFHEDREWVLRESLALFVGRHLTYEYRFVHANGSIIWIRDEQQLVTDEHGHPKEVLCAWTDISKHKLQEIDRSIAGKAFETKDGIMITDKNNRIVRVNSAFTLLTGYTAEEVIGRTPAILNSGRQSIEFYSNMWGQLANCQHWEGEIWNRRKDGSIYPEWLTISVVTTDQGIPSHYVAMFFDMSERKAAEENIRNLAYYDPLTGLPNRRLMIDRLNMALTNSNRSNHHGALMFMDLDRFKILNDTQGHDKGDQLLVQAARRIQSCIREGDTVARLGGDEFVVMLENLSLDQTEAAIQAQYVAEKIHVSLGTPYFLDDKENNLLEHHSSASIGMVIFLGHHLVSEDLLKRADMAMYQAKHAGRDAIRVFDPVMQSALNERTAMEIDLRQAVKFKQFMLYYQMQVDNQDRVVGAEALVRWQHPERGLVQPDKFIPLAEETGLILPIGLWVLQEGCRTLAKWGADANLASLSLAINVSARQFRQSDFVEVVQEVLVSSGINPSRLKLEVTETLIMDNLQDTIAKMHAIKALGVGFAMDDFGTGYSSLSNLQKLPLDQLKVDRGFVCDLADSAHDTAIIRTILGLGQTLGLIVIAEGVETAIQHDYLTEYGCPIFQGYYFAKPVPLGAFEQSVVERDGRLM